MRLQCDCCKSVLDVSETGEESALFIELRKKGMLRCPACNGYLMRPIPDYETPDQYEKRTGEALPDDAGVWCRWNISNNHKWYSNDWGEVRHLEDDVYRNTDIVVFNGPYAPPEDYHG